MGSLAGYKVSSGLKCETLNPSAFLVSRTDLNEITANNTNLIFPRIILYLRQFISLRYERPQTSYTNFKNFDQEHTRTQLHTQYDVCLNCAVSWTPFSLNFSRLISFLIVIVCCQRFIRYEQ